MKFDAGDMTVRDLNDFFDITGVEWEDMSDDTGTIVMPRGKSPKILLAMAFIAGRQVDKSFTLDDAYDCKVVELVGGVAEEGEVPAPTAEPDPLSSGSGSSESESSEPAPTVSSA